MHCRTLHCGGVPAAGDQHASLQQQHTHGRTVESAGASDTTVRHSEWILLRPVHVGGPRAKASSPPLPQRPL